MLPACSTPPAYTATAPKVTQEKLAFEIPDFSVAEVLASADEATRAKLIGKARATFINTLNELGLKARHLNDSHFDISAAAELSQIYTNLGTKLGRQDVSTWIVQSAGIITAEGLQTVSIIAIVIEPCTLGIWYSDDATVKLSGLPIASGGKAAALEFLEACEVLGVDINREARKDTPLF
jgi:hypothetical protein